jgi:hypothetical protein
MCFTVLFQSEKANDSAPYSSVAVIHAVPGRLLRFRGSVTHAVPRPALAYFDPEVGGSNTEIFTPVRRGLVPVEERRSVLLFNTWDIAPTDIALTPPHATLELAQRSEW